MYHWDKAVRSRKLILFFKRKKENKNLSVRAREGAKKERENRKNDAPCL